MRVAAHAYIELGCRQYGVCVSPDRVIQHPEGARELVIGDASLLEQSRQRLLAQRGLVLRAAYAGLRSAHHVVEVAVAPDVAPPEPAYLPHRMVPLGEATDLRSLLL